MSHLRLGGCLCLCLAACSPIRGPAIRDGGLVTRTDQAEVSCPAEVQEHVKVAASAGPWLNGGPAPEDGSGRMLVGRTVLISVSPDKEVADLRLVNNILTITTVGGTFRGAADGGGVTAGEGPEGPRVREISASRALDVIPGRLRITPFITGAALRPQTLSLDVLMIPGGAPLDEMVIKPEALWDAQGHPMSSERATISLAAARHLTIYDQVFATVALQFAVSRRAKTGAQWSCSAESRFTLIDRAATAPGLWDVRDGAGGKAELWLALSSAAAGPFRAIFANPADANGFANWLRQTHATHVGAYELGMFRPGYSRENLRTLPEPNSIAETFRRISAEDVEGLVAGRLGEP